MEFRSSGVLILAMLASGKNYAQGIVKAIDRASEGRIRLHRSSVHYALRRLVRQRLVVTHWRITPNGKWKEERRHYRLTAAGQAAFELFSKIFGELLARHAIQAAKRPKQARGL